MEISSQDLKRFYPLDSMRIEHLELLAKEGQTREWKKRDVLFKAGDSDNDAHFLLAGGVRGEYPDGRIKEVSADSVQSRYAIGDLQPRRFTANVTSATAQTLCFDRRFLEKVLTWDQLTRSGMAESDPNPDNNRWVFRMLQTKAVQKLPAGNLERLFSRFHEVDVKGGQDVVKEGDDGDYFYVIKDGSASVSKRMDTGVSVVAYLVRGDSFGEDALISNEPRNATVTMKKDGKLMRLSKSDFQELLKHPVIDWVTAGKASILVRQGAVVLDVRLKEEYDDRAIKGAINLPLYLLREQAGNLDKAKQYIVYCNTGERSAAGAFILSKLGFEIYALQGGISAMIRGMEVFKRPPT